MRETLTSGFVGGRVPAMGSPSQRRRDAPLPACLPTRSLSPMSRACTRMLLPRLPLDVERYPTAYRAGSAVDALPAFEGVPMNDRQIVPDRPATMAFTDSNEPDPLPVLQAGGFGACVDAFAWEPDPGVNPPRMCLWLVSLLGSQQAVKALWAQLIKGETATLSTEATGVRFCALASEGARAWRFYRTSLPASGGYHGLLLPDVALLSSERPDFLLVRRAEDDAAKLHYRFLNRRVALPLHPSWADWLWNRALRSGEARALASHGLVAYRCVPDESALASDLEADIRRGALGLSDEHTGQAHPPDTSPSSVQEVGRGTT